MEPHDGLGEVAAWEHDEDVEDDEGHDVEDEIGATVDAHGARYHRRAIRVEGGEDADREDHEDQGRDPSSDRSAGSGHDHDQAEGAQEDEQDELEHAHSTIRPTR